MSQAVADRLRGIGRIAVNDAYRLAPDAEALAANDAAWWKAHPAALSFAGRKFSCSPMPKPVEVVLATDVIGRGSNSALLAVHVAIRYFGATLVELHGVHLKGSHFFGPHVAPDLANTTEKRFRIFGQQFAAYAATLPPGVEIVNCTPDSALTCFPFEVGL